ncbi:hypothetical protein Hypma_013795 [Hypsizygus marmoreus]|uniref:Zn(2)-C6 fungal-type domain-containing protein n=1 Tax=Hypsizygus marmoreus TaxID=39966 RepID=A0A369KGA7_HYPMA|nr:hypothetical protein Hypma_013795 [Hypsizygus marmoreus]
MSYYNHHHPSLDDSPFPHYSEQEKYHFRRDGMVNVSHADHVPDMYNVSRQESQRNAWEEGMSEQQQVLAQQPQQHELYAVPQNIDASHNFVVKQEPEQNWLEYEYQNNLAHSQTSQMPRTQYQKTVSFSPPPANQLSGFDPINASSRLTLSGSLDPSTGIFYRIPEHPRLRTAQACEKCRTRKAKCSGEHPSCKRCTNRGLTCEYAKEGRVRGPNKPKVKRTDSKEEVTRPSPSRRSSSTAKASPGSDSTDPFPLAVSQALQPHEEGQGKPGGMGAGPSSAHRRNSMPVSMGTQRSTRPRPPNLQLESSSNYYRLEGPRSSDGVRRPRGYFPGDPTTTTPLSTTTQLQSPDDLVRYGHGHGQPFNMGSVAHLLATYGGETYDDSGSSTSSAGERYGQMGIDSEYRGGSHSESGSNSNPPSAVSSTFDTTTMTMIGSPPMGGAPALVMQQQHHQHHHQQQYGYASDTGDQYPHQNHPHHQFVDANTATPLHPLHEAAAIWGQMLPQPHPHMPPGQQVQAQYDLDAGQFVGASEVVVLEAEELDADKNMQINYALALHDQMR